MLRLSRLVGAGYLVICLAALAATALIGPVGYSPARLPFARTPEPVVVTIWYGTEKKAWLEDAAQRFAATDPHVGARPVQVVLRGMGSGEQVERVAARDWRADGAPTAISPASATWVETLRADWAARNPGQPDVVAGGQLAPTSLAQSPLVIVAWRERGDLIWRDKGGSFWGQLHDALAQPSWTALGGSQSWGPVKLGQTSPATSNSGYQALALLAYGRTGATSGLTAAEAGSAEAQAWLDTFEAAVPSFGDSTGELMTTMLQRGPSTYDLAIVYENLAIEGLRAPRTWGALRVYYPPATLAADSPFAILSAPWATDDQREGARLFREFLLSPAIQGRAELAGLRPARGATLPAGEQSPFAQLQGDGVRADMPPLLEAPAREASEALLAAWRQKYGR